MHKKIHLIGIGGTAMATLAALLKQKGFEVRGSDQNIYPPMSTFLEREGIETLSGYAAEHITADLDLVVVGNAISRGNPEVEEVLDRKIRYCSLPEAVREHFLWGARSDRRSPAPTARRRRRRWPHGCSPRPAATRACWSAASPRTSATTARATASGAAATS